MLRTFLLLSLVTTMVTACSLPQKPKSIIPERSTEYLHAKNLPPLKTPPGMSTATDTRFPIPASASGRTQVDLTPPGL